jgi:hypothetical protein
MSGTTSQRPVQVDSKLTALLIQDGPTYFNGKMCSLSPSPEED